MAQQNIIDIFDDCLSRRAAGQTIEDCLRVYPTHAQRLRPLLEAGEAVRSLQPARAEMFEDQALVWRQIEAQLPTRMAVANRRRRPRVLLQLLAAVLILLLMMAATWFVLTRPDLPDQENIVVPIINTGTVTATTSATPTATFTPSAPPVTSTLAVTETGTPRPLATLNPPRFVSPPAAVTPSSIAPLSTATVPPAPLQTAIPTATFAPGCGAPLTEADARARVLAIYPSTNITSIQQVTKFGGTLVWEVQTSHGIEVNVDVACGTVLTIERQDGGSGTGSGSSNDNSTGSNGGTSGSGNDNFGDGSEVSGGSSGNDNSGSVSGNDNSGSGSGDDNSGMGSGDDDDGSDDNSGMGSDDDDDD